MAVRECGWPAGPSANDGHCGVQTVVVYLIQAANVPLSSTDDETHTVALGLCPLHDPHREHRE